VEKKMYIERIEGTVVDKIEKGNIVLVERNGITYRIVATLSKMNNSMVGAKTIIFIYQHIIETDETWYGFNSKDDVELFKNLIKVKGVGPAKAIKVLGYPSDIVIQAIALKDERLFKSIPGFGEKMIDQVFLTLESKYKIK
jgi:Holliday junction DNA helicase RuvA